MEWEPQGKETLCKMLPQEKQGKTKSLGSFLFHSSRPQSPQLSPTGQTWPDTSWPKIDPDPPPSSPGGTGRALPFPSPQGKEQEEEAGTAGQEEESKGGKAEKGGGKAHRSAQDFIS